MKLLLDVGNSRIKWAMLGDELRPGEPVARSPDFSTTTLAQALAAVPLPDSVLVSNVGGRKIAEALTGMSEDLWKLSPRFIQVEREKHGVRVAYPEPAQLGVDRWLAMLAARQASRVPVCVVGCGTAVTVDGVDSDGAHLGGWIIPGIEAMQGLLLRTTDGITATPLPAQPGFGRSTAECISNGPAAAIAAMIDVAVERITAHAGTAPACTLTGGGAGAIMKLLRTGYRHDPELVLRGLALFR